MKLGDLIKVRYINKNAYHSSSDEFDIDYVGILIETPDCHRCAIYKMWCFKTETVHALMPERDIIEVLNENR